MSTAVLLEGLRKAAAAKEIVDDVVSDINWVRNTGRTLIGKSGMPVRIFKAKATSKAARKSNPRRRAKAIVTHSPHGSSYPTKGYFVGTPSPCKKTQITNVTQTTIAGRSLSVTQLSLVARVNNLAAGLDIDKRLTDLIHLSGIKLQVFHQNNINDVYGVNYAVVTTRNSQTLDNTPPVLQFFGGNNNVRSEAFDSTKTGLELHVLPLNTDKFEVHWHKRVILGTAGGTVKGITDYKPWTLIDEYIPLNKEIRYTDAQPTSAVSAPILLMWCDRLNSAASSGGDASMGLRQLHITAYWREKQ